MKNCITCQTKLRGNGTYFVKHRRVYVKRYRCNICNKSVSRQSSAANKFHKKSHLNRDVPRLYCNGMSLRGIARCLGVHYTTVYRKFLWAHENLALNRTQCWESSEIFLDEMETIEHTKLKPLTIALVVTKDYKILAASVGKLPPKGHLAQVSRAKYGTRVDESKSACTKALQLARSQLPLQPLKIYTDQKPTYPGIIAALFPGAKHIAIKRKIDEKPFIKYNKKRFDPLFVLNQRCAKLRSDIKRLVRRSWCTTKKIENLQKQLDIYMAYNNGLLA